MVLTSIDILDTGYLSVGKLGGQLESSQRVNSGTALRLKGVEFIPESTANLDESPLLAQYVDRNIPVNSIQPTQFTIRIFLGANNIDTNNYWGINDMANAAHLLRLTKTLGIKALYYPVTVAATGDTRGRDSQLAYILGRTDTTEPQTGISLSAWNGSSLQASLNLTHIKYIPVRFKTCRIPQTASGSIIVELTGVFCG
jgi:hypothetical protein